ncbi:MAG TPA: TetR/AcrR family transcriptional regulator [Steroidobacteraceae bacterium]|nr:TetR/AcrR family transcriptional regulator [Steroidobacteraceae bacterium]
MPTHRQISPAAASRTTEAPPLRRGQARERILDAAMQVIRQKGYAATTVDDLCAAAGVTKGAFFHHFASKEDVGVAAARHWSAVTGALFAGAAYHEPTDPLDRLFAYLDFRAALIQGTTAEFTCLAGTMVQETFATAPAIRDACCDSIASHAATLEADFTAAIAAYGAPPGVTAASFAMHTQAVLQGAFILAKAKDDPAIAFESIEHLRRYLALTFGREPPGVRAQR